MQSNKPKTDDIMIDFEQVLGKYALPIKESLAPPLKMEYINMMLSKMKIVDETIVKLYQWKNGVVEDKSQEISHYDFCSFGKMIPFDKAISMYLALTIGKAWRKGLFPIITTNAGDFLLLDIEKKSKTYGMILVYSPGLLIIKPEVAYDSLSNFFETLIDCFEKGVYKFDNTEKLLEINDDSEFEIASIKNPQSSYWHQ